MDVGNILCLDRIFFLVLFYFDREKNHIELCLPTNFLYQILLDQFNNTYKCDSIFGKTDQ